MKRTPWALITYGLSILLLLVMLFVKGPDERLAAAFLLTVNLCSLLALLYQEREWDATHWLGLGLLVLTAPFLILFLATTHTGVSYLYGSALVFASFVLFVTEILADWRASPVNTFLSRFHKEEHAEEKENEEHDVVVEQITPKHEPRFLARKGTKLYHRENCIALRSASKEELISMTESEALAYGLEPCRACKPQRE